MELIRNIKLKKIRNTFQKKLKKDIKLIKESNKIMVFVDKISNMYRLAKEQYDQLIINSIASTYKRQMTTSKNKLTLPRKT